MKELQDKLALNEGADSALDARVKELDTADKEMQDVIPDIVTKLQAGDAGALAAATPAQA